MTRRMMYSGTLTRMLEDHGPMMFRLFAIGIGAVAGFWDGLPSMTRLLVGLMAVDIVLGLMVAVSSGTLSKERSFDGITKKVIVGLLVGVSAMVNPMLQPILQFDLVQAVSAGYCAHELVSIMRNATGAGVPIPDELRRALVYLRARQDERSKRQDARDVRQDERAQRQDIRGKQQDDQES